MGIGVWHTLAAAAGGTRDDTLCASVQGGGYARLNQGSVGSACVSEPSRYSIATHAIQCH